MKNLKPFLLASLGIGMHLYCYAHIDPRDRKAKPTNQVEFRTDCQNALAQIDLEVNNVRTRLLTGGDLWWNGDDGRYIIPKVAVRALEVSSGVG